MHENIKITDKTVTVVDIHKAFLQPLLLPEAAARDILIDVLRLDQVHPVISGNKCFKLKYHLLNATEQKKKGVLTFGGAWSNHLVATAYAAKDAGLSCIGIVRGEKPAYLSNTLQDAVGYGMELLFISREQFAADNDQYWKDHYPDHLVVPHGGGGEEGIRGAAEILQLVNADIYTHIACAVGTGTMFAGLVRASLSHQQVLGISSLKIADPQRNSILDFVQRHVHQTNFQLFYTYHFGGYAKKNEALLQFMNRLYDLYHLPTDLVYTGKLLFGITDLINNNFFHANSRLLIVHSGGLQGNRSLAPGILRF